MKCINRFCRIRFSCIAALLCVFLLTGCGNISYTFPYNVNSNVSSFNVLAGTGTGKADAFASDLCVVTEDRMGDGSVDMTQASAAVLFDVNNREVLYSKNAHERLYPASLTKVMTALVALKNASLDTVLTATDSVKINESGAQLCGLKSGDTMTLDQALHILLMYSANDAAMLIAENVGGSVDHFVEMMNEKAQELNMKDSHFSNPSGLDEEDEGNVSTVKDMALLYDYCCQNPIFNEIVQTKVYKRQDGMGSWHNKNRLLKDYSYCVGGKTGFTKKARRTLITRAVKGNHDLIIVTFNCGNDFEFHKKKYEECFETMEKQVLFDKGVYVIGGKPYLFDESLFIEKKKEDCVSYIIKDESVYLYVNQHYIRKQKLKRFCFVDLYQMILKDLFYE